ncbi:hypothetical protein GMOD_00006079 [Pyrenophora seminiperda CCB06]|uniref:Uncharacterized protein n=1 Tax=Pyrenophora seminiperda CCB06 TaxID=1302712 RepID=A0A3M7M482_9PLEO|nr:hypothetical protein GMOD_00006079 [Pyrenophora seminiperda CCB06]
MLLPRIRRDSAPPLRPPPLFTPIARSPSLCLRRRASYSKTQFAP